MARKNRKTINVGVAPGTPEWWNAEAAKHGYIYDGSGRTGQFLDAIACGEYVVVSREVWEKIFSKSA